jgi:hypothetical protein
LTGDCGIDQGIQRDSHGKPWFDCGKWQLGLPLPRRIGLQEGAVLASHGDRARDRKDPLVAGGLVFRQIASRRHGRNAGRRGQARRTREEMLALRDARNDDARRYASRLARIGVARASLDWNR